MRSALRSQACTTIRSGFNGFMDISAQPAASAKPEWFRLPSRGPDPFFGLTRSYYYTLESEGKIQLTRVRSRGALRGITLVPYDKVAAFIRSQETVS